MAKQDEAVRTGGSPGNEQPRDFVNQIKLSLSLSEVRFDLLAVGARSLSQVPAWRFVTTPDHLVAIHRDLGSALDRYCARFGDICAAAMTPADIGYHDDRRGDLPGNPRGTGLDG